MGTLYILSYLQKFQKYWSIISQRVLEKLEYWVGREWSSEARGYVQDITQTVKSEEISSYLAQELKGKSCNHLKIPWDFES